jgi:hypothetical protein
MADPSKTVNPLPISLTISASRFKLGELLDRPVMASEQQALVFDRLTHLSDSFRVLNAEVANFDSFKVCLLFECDLSHIHGVLLRYTVVNPNALRYEQFNRLFLAVLIGYSIFVSVGFLKIGAEVFYHKFLVLLGSVALFASNPFFSLFPPLIDHAFAAAFAALFRMFVLLQLAFIRSRNPVPKMRFVVTLAVLFVCYATIDTSASLAGFQRGFASGGSAVSDSEVYRMCFDCAYICLALGSLIGTVVMFDLVHLRRLLFLGGLILGMSFVTIATHVSGVLMDIGMDFGFSGSVFRSVHVTLCAAVLFLFHSDSEIVYDGLKDEDRIDVGLEMEAASSPAEAEGFDGRSDDV